MQNRRTFLGSAAAAGVGAAVGGSLFLPTSLPHAQAHAVIDPVMAELQMQLADTVIAIRKGRGKAGEHARRIAGHVRLLNAHGVAAAADAQLRRLLRQEGRDALLAREIDPKMLAAEMKAIGIERLPTFSATYADRALMLDATITHGMAATLTDISARFDEIAPVLDRHAVTTVAVRQDGDECWQWLIFLTNLESVSWEWCVLNPMLCSLFIGFYYAWASFMCALGCLCVV